MATSVSRSQWNGNEIEPDGTNRSPVSLHYTGKKSETSILHYPPGQYTTLYAQGNNRLYFGDNLKALAALRNDPDISGKVNLIYIDPPFATGGVFKSRDQEAAYTDLLRGADYLEFIRERLILLRALLAETGSIYVHLDGNMVFAVKIIMDEVFGAGNFRNLIVRKKCNPKNYTRKVYGNVSDYILFYTKSDTYTWHRAFESWTPASAEKEYPYIDEHTGRRYKKVPIHAPGTRNGETGKPWRGMSPPPGKHWQYVPATLDAMDARGEIYWSPNGNPRRKIFLDDSAGKPVQDIWLDMKDAHNQNIHITGYPTEKNPALLERIIAASSMPGDIVLDCFCGSGTTLVVAHQLQRRWIGIDNSLEAITTTLKRFVFDAQPMGDFVTDRATPQMTLFDENDTTPSKPMTQQCITDFSLLCDAELPSADHAALAPWIHTFEKLILRR